MKPILLASLVLSSPAFATDPECLVRFAAVGPESAAEHAENAYGELLETLGKRLTLETLREIAAGDPFHVPERSDVDLDALRTNLKRLRSMLTANNWNSAELRARLQGVAKDRAERLARANETVVRKIDSSWVDIKLEGNAGPPAFAISPDARFVVLIDVPEASHSNSSRGWMQVTDRWTRKSERYRIDLGKKFVGTLAYSPDGKHLIYNGQDYSLLAVPIDANGVPDVKTVKEFPRSMMSSRILAPRGSENQNFAYGEMTNPIMRYDLITQQLTRVDLEKEQTENWTYDPKAVGNRGQTQDAYATLENRDTKEGRLIVMPMPGKQTPGRAAQPAQSHQVLAVWGPELSMPDVHWTADNQPITVHDGAFYRWPTPKTPVLVAARKTDGIVPADARVFASTGHPNGAAVFYTTNEKRWAQYVDYATGKVREIVLPPKTERITLSADGTMLVAQEFGFLHLINYRERE